MRFSLRDYELLSSALSQTISGAPSVDEGVDIELIRSYRLLMLKIDAQIIRLQRKQLL